MAASEKTLIIILSETRAAELTFESFKTHLLDPFQADLALCIADNERETKDNPFRQAATYTWTCPEYEDWGEAFETLYENVDANWRDLNKIGEQWLGGVKGPHAQAGSAGILIFFRLFLKKCLIEDNMISKYDRFIITRSDFLYEVPHYPPRFLDCEHIWIPNGEQYGGYTDRHIICPADKILDVLSVNEAILFEPAALATRMQHRQNWGLETFLKLRFDEVGLDKHIKSYPYTMFAVRAENGHTSWSKGQNHASRGYYIKYHSEFRRAGFARQIIGHNGQWSRIKGFLFNMMNRVYRIYIACKQSIFGLPDIP